MGADDSSLPGLTIPEWFQGNEQEITLNLDTARVANGSYSSHIAVQTDNGTARIPVSYTVVPLELTFEPQVLDFGAIEVGKKARMALQHRADRRARRHPARLDLRRAIAGRNVGARPLRGPRTVDHHR